MTFVAKEFAPRVKEATDGEVINGHYGIDCRTVLVRKMGLKIVDGRTDRQNEVWVGKRVNMAAESTKTSSCKRLVEGRCGNVLTIRVGLWTFI